jgi:hypothetical protein
VTLTSAPAFAIGAWFVGGCWPVALWMTIDLVVVDDAGVAEHFHPQAIRQTLREQVAVDRGDEEPEEARSTLDRAGALELRARAAHDEPLVVERVEVEVGRVELELGGAVRQRRAGLVLRDEPEVRAARERRRVGIRAGGRIDPPTAGHEAAAGVVHHDVLEHALAAGAALIGDHQPDAIHARDAVRVSSRDRPAVAGVRDLAGGGRAVAPRPHRAVCRGVGIGERPRHRNDRADCDGIQRRRDRDGGRRARGERGLRDADDEQRGDQEANHPRPFPLRCEAPPASLRVDATREPEG